MYKDRSTLITILRLYLVFVFIYRCLHYTFFFFFFQAEDGIRDLTVTGVQTCALPISPGFDYAWGDAQIDFQDHEGDWWIPTSHGVIRFAKPGDFADLAHARPKAIY